MKAGEADLATKQQELETARQAANKTQAELDAKLQRLREAAA